MRALACAPLLLCASAAAAQSLEQLSVPDLVLPGSDGKSHRLPELVSAAPLTVFVFFARGCPCLAVHDESLRTLANDYAARGVKVWMIDSEAGSSLEEDQQQAQARGYPFPILRDEHGALIDALGVRFASGTVVFDRRGRAHYRGGIDASRRSAAPPEGAYLRQALDALLSGREPANAEPKALGCYLRRE